MQWKGPFEISAVVGLNDYKVSVKGKERIYHANLLKRYFEREKSVPVGAVCVEVNTTSSKNEHVKGDVEEVNPVDDVNFLEILGFHQSCDQNQNRNHSMNRVKNLGYDK